MRLFADSAGFCQNPACTYQLFEETSSDHIHVAEMAHILAASDDGPRADPSLTEAQRGEYDNLILLCANCHTKIDKAESDYPDTLIRSWKRQRVERLAALFGARQFETRLLVRQAISPLMAENGHIHREYGPDTDIRFDPEDAGADIWRRKVVTKILPNNRRILAIVDANRAHMVGDEENTLEEFRQHIDDMEARHLEGVPGGRRYPLGMLTMMAAT